MAKHRWVILALVLLAFALRVYRLESQSMWSDEGLSLYRARLPLAENLTNVIVVPPGVRTMDTNPPLYFVLLSGLRAAMGESEFALRFLSVMAGVVVVPLLYALGRRLFSTSTGVMAAALGALSPFLVWYSQEARMYTLLAALSLASVYLLVRTLALASDPLLPSSTAGRGGRGSRGWLAWFIVTGAALYTHFTMFFLLPFEGGVIVVALARKRKREAIAAAIGLATLAAPLMIYAWSRATMTGDAVFGFRPLDSVVEELWGTFSIGWPNGIFQPLWAVAPALAMFVLGAVDGFIGRPRHITPPLLALAYVLVVLLLFYAVTFIRPLYTGPRHLMLLAPPFYLLVGNGLATAWRRARIVSVAALAWIAGMMLIWLRVQFFDPTYLKDDMRSAARVVSEQAQADDVVIVHDALSSFVFDYYYDGAAPWLIIPTYPSLDVSTALAEFEVRAQTAARVWFISDPPPLNGFPRNVLDEWARGHLLRLDHQRFASLWLGSAYQLYTARFPILDALPASAEKRDVAWQGGLRLVGVETLSPLPFLLHSGGADGEGSPHLALYWMLDAPVNGNFVLTVRLTDPSGTVWFDRSDRIFDNWSAKRWPVGKVIRQEWLLDSPADLLPGDYNVRLSIGDRESGQPIALTDGSGEATVISVTYAGVNE